MRYPIPLPPKRVIIGCKKPIYAVGVLFQRGKGNKWEQGIAILKYPGVTDVDVIIDRNCELVPYKGLWTYQFIPNSGLAKNGELA